MNELTVHGFGSSPWVSLAAIALLEAIGVYVLRFGREPGALHLAIIQACKAVWLLALLVTDSPLNARSLVFWMDAGSLAAMALITVGYLFLAELWGMEARTQRRMNGANLAILAVYAAVLVSDPWHHGYWHLSVAAGQPPRLEGGPIRALALGVNWALALGYLVLCVAWMKKERGLRRRQAEMVLLAMIVSWAGALLNQWLKTRSPDYSTLTLSAAFVLSSLVVTWAFLRWRMLGLLPLAREAVLHERVDGLLMLDLEGQIVLLSKAARTLFPKVNLREGDRFTKAADDWPALAVLAENRGECQFDVARQSPTGRLTYEVAQTPLSNSVGQPLGRVVTFRNVTEERCEQSRKLEQSKATTMLEERQRLGRELHDNGQIWSFLATQTQTVQYLLERKRTARALEIVERMIEVQADRTFGMRESMLALQTELSEEHDLARALEEHLGWYRHYCDIDAQFCLEAAWEPMRIPLPEQAQLLRIAQEALANARKHAAARNVRVCLNMCQGKVTLSIADDGCGFDKEKAARIEGHFGLKTMRERAESIGARFELLTAPGAGSRIAVELPLE